MHAHARNRQMTHREDTHRQFLRRQTVVAVAAAIVAACLALTLPAARRAAAYPIGDPPLRVAPPVPRAAPRALLPAASALLGRIAVQALNLPETPPVVPSKPVGLAHAFALLGNLPLVLPAENPVYIGFHEASNPRALPLIPFGHLLISENEGKFTVPTSFEDGKPYTVMASRGRGTSAASAADIVLEPGQSVRAVVSGTVTEARPYLLYGLFPDYEVRIRLADRPDLVVTMLHMTGLRVAVGQKVTAGETIVADSANQFPFVSQVDEFLGGAPHAHVHIEVAPAPGGP